MTAPGETVRLLADRIRQLESSFRLCEPASIPLGSSGLGDLFPEQGLAAGSLVELLPGVPGAGAWTLALLLASYACGERKTLLIADPERCFYPPAARKFGLDASRIVIVRPRTARDALHALGQALRCSAIGTAIGEFERLQDREVRRLQLAAESGGTVGVLLRPVSALGAPSFASVRLLMHPEPADRNVCPTGSWRRVRLEVLRCQGGRDGKSLCVEIDDATGHVRAFSPLELAADMASPARPAG
jgi:protein ImuA